jgi:hypothetical protein
MAESAAKRVANDGRALAEEWLTLDKVCVCELVRVRVCVCVH